MQCDAGKKESLKRAYMLFIALALEAMELISDCKKVYFSGRGTDPEQSEKETAPRGKENGTLFPCIDGIPGKYSVL